MPFLADIRSATRAGDDVSEESELDQQTAENAEPEWNPATGTFARPAKVAEMTSEQFAEMIAARFGKSSLDSTDKALSMLDNAAVYLHGVDPANRLDRSPTINSIADEWASLGVSEKEATFMLERTIEHSEIQQLEAQGEQEHYPIARGGRDVNGNWHSNDENEQSTRSDEEEMEL